MQDPLEQDLQRLITQLEQDIRRLILTFDANVRLVVLRSLQSRFGRTEHLDDHNLSPGADLPRVAVDHLPAPRISTRHNLTPEESMAVRVKLTALIRQQPGQSTAELARNFNLSTVKLRRQLQRLIDERVIEVESTGQGAFRRHTYRAAEPRPEAHAEPLALLAGASG